MKHLRIRNHSLRLLAVCGVLLFLLATNQAQNPELGPGNDPVPTSKPAEFPKWWFTRGVIPRVTNTNSPAWPANYKVSDDYSALNQGQLKALAAAAYDEFERWLPGGAGISIKSMVNGWYTTNEANERVPKTTGVNDFAAINLGQLKNIAKPFHDRIRLEYPWYVSANEPDDYAIANLGQAKNLFKFDPASDNDGDRDNDGIPDAWELDPTGTGGGGGNLDPDVDSDGDGLSNAEEFALGTNPFSTDSDGDGVIDSLDAAPSDPDKTEDVPVIKHAAINVSQGFTSTGHPVKEMCLGKNGTLAFWFEPNTASFTTVCWDKGDITWEQNIPYEFTDSDGKWKLHPKGIGGNAIVGGDAQYVGMGLSSAPPPPDLYNAFESVTTLPSILLGRKCDGVGRGGHVYGPGTVRETLKEPDNDESSIPAQYESGFIRTFKFQELSLIGTQYAGYDLKWHMKASPFSDTDAFETKKVSYNGLRAIGLHSKPSTALPHFSNDALGSFITTPIHPLPPLIDQGIRIWKPFNDFSPVVSETAEFIAISDLGVAFGTSDGFSKVADAPAGAKHPFLGGADPDDIYQSIPPKFQKQIKITEAIDLSPSGKWALVKCLSKEGKVGTGEWVDRTLVVKLDGSLKVYFADTGSLGAVQVDDLGCLASKGSQDAFLLLPIELVQKNYPVLTDSTDPGTRVEQQIGENKIAYITALPEMPKLEAKIGRFSTPELGVEWRLEVKSERQERRTKDDLKIPNVGVITRSLNEELKFEDYFAGNAEFFGGKCKLFFRLKSQEGAYLAPEQVYDFKIRGKNPKDSVAKQYIIETQGNFRFAWAMVQHESREDPRIFNQFNPSGETKELPDFGEPDGWGIAQLDTPLGKTANTKEVYSWKENLTTFYKELMEKSEAQERYFAAVKKAYPTNYEAPPLDFVWKGTSTHLSGLEAGVITLYNGVKSCPTFSTRGSSGKLSTFQNPWAYDPTAATGKKWTYHPNDKDYLKLVLYNEYEAHTPFQE